MSSERHTIPPIMQVPIRETGDIQVARNSARRVASLLGFAPTSRAQISSVAATLADMILNADKPGIELYIHGLQSGAQNGIQITCEAPWLTAITRENAQVALQTKLGEMVDEIEVTPGADRTAPRLQVLLWLSPARTQSENPG
jgi:hypothetical protein